MTLPAKINYVHYYLARIAMLLLFCLILVDGIKAQTNPERKPLAGLRAVSVLVEEIKTELESEGITKNQTQTDVELRLRKAGIQVTDFGSTYLYVKVNVLRANEHQFAFSITVQLDQPVILARDRSILTLAPTWGGEAWLGFVGSAKLQHIREMTGSYVDMFINDYLAANPSTIQMPKPSTTNRKRLP